MAPVSYLFSALTAFFAIHTAQAAPASANEPSVTLSPRAAGDGAPYNNPYDDVPLPVVWPGLPEKGQKTPSPKPGPAFKYGGSAASKYEAPGWVPTASASAGNLLAALSQDLTNGLSPLGEIDKIALPYNLPPGKGPAYSKVYPRPTTTLTVGQTPTSGPCGKAPDTGVTRTYNFNVAYQTIAPDGVKKNGLLINGQFPGPHIQANYGDWIKVTVNNQLPNEGTTIHWHGLLQAKTPYYDGVPAVAQCPIPPKASHTYLFQADVHGTTWYHSHYSGQYAGGAWGPITIYGPRTAAYDIDLGPIMLSDHYHQDYFTLVNLTMNGGVPQANNVLINGKMNYPCKNTTLPCTPNAGVSKFRFKAGKKHRLRLINTSAEATMKFSIDGHTMKVIANDMIPIVPYDTSVVTLGVGQRSDVVVTAKKSPKNGAYWMRANSKDCSFTDGVSPVGVAAIYYDRANTKKLPTTKFDGDASILTRCTNDDLSKTVAWCATKPDPKPPTTKDIEIKFESNGTHFVWKMNGQSYRGNYNNPALLAVGVGNMTFEKEWNVFDFGTNSSVRMIIRNNFAFGTHPMHLHGHNFHVLAEGTGEWDGTVTNPGNTQMRDVHMVPSGVQNADGTVTDGYMVIQWQQDNPAVWPFHCHIAWHVSGGLYINVLERPKDVGKIKFPGNSKSTCQAWADYTGTHIVDQIDSGL